MKYKSVNELDQFSFCEAHISEVSQFGDTFKLALDNVTILPTNPHNRDIQEMRANETILTFAGSHIKHIIAEGYKVYDANMNLSEEISDSVVSEENYQELFGAFAEASIYSLEIPADNLCVLVIDTEERTYCITLSYHQAVMEWDRFLKKE